jgi:DNA-binding Lrp family transcriptional regulator
MLLKPPDRERGVKQERILRILLTHPDGELTKYRIAQTADVSEPWVREYTERLAENGWLDDTAVVQPRALYEEWREVRVSPTEVAVAFQQPMDLLAETDLTYALTTYQAETVIQGFLFPSTTDLYVHPEETGDWTTVIEEQGLLGGGNTRLRVTDAHVFDQQQRRDGYPVVSTPQLIVDLLDEGGPCTEAADHLIDAVHGGE